jgi:hypothetical protein
MGVCMSCGRNNNQASPAVEQLRTVRRCLNEDVAACASNRQNGDKNGMAGSSMAANDVESASPEPRIPLHMIGGQKGSVRLPPRTPSDVWATRGPAKCVWSDEELVESLWRDRRNIYARPTAKTNVTIRNIHIRPTARPNVLFKTTQHRRSDRANFDNEEAIISSDSEGTLCTKPESREDSTRFKVAVPIDVPIRVCV